MPSAHPIAPNQNAVQIEHLTWFRFGRLDNKVILTTDTGAWHALAPNVFSQLISGELPEEDAEYATLKAKGFIRSGFDVAQYSIELRQNNARLNAGPTHHRIHLSTPKDVLSIEQAKAILDHVFTSESPTLTLCLVQGPKPPNVDLIGFIHAFAEQKNQQEKRDVFFELHSALNGFNQDLIGLLVEKQIQLRAIFHGCSDVHDAQRSIHSAPSYAEALEHIKAVHHSATDLGFNPSIFSVFGDVHIGFQAKGRAQSIISGLEEAGIREFQISPILSGDQAIDPSDIGPFVQELLTALDNRPDTSSPLQEVHFAALLTRLRSKGAAGSRLMSTPPSTGLNTRSYGPNGDIFPSCSALQLHEDGDPMFLLGHVASTSMEDVSNHSTVRSLMVASLPDCLPGYQHLWSAPFIGIDPVAVYCATGDIFTQMPTSHLHQSTQAMVEALFLSQLLTDM